MIPAVSSNQSFGAEYVFNVLPQTKIKTLYSELPKVCQENGRVFKNISKSNYIPKDEEAIVECFKRNGDKMMVVVRDSIDKFSQKFNQALVDLGVKLCTLT